MDKTFNNLMDIVSRTKKIDEKEGRVSRPRQKVESDTSFDEPKKEVKPAKTSLFEGKDAINNYLSTSKTKKAKGTSKTTKSTAKKTTKKSTKTATKKSTTKSTKTTKTSTKKKDVAEELLKNIDDATKGVKKEDKKARAKDIADKFQLINKKTVVKPTKQAPALDMNDPKNVELYNALKETLLAGGTDVSEYMNEGVTAKQLGELISQKKAQNINDEITREQQEYEKLFTGSFFDEATPNNEEMTDDSLQEYFAKQQAQSDENNAESMANVEDNADEQNADREMPARRNRFDADLDEFNNRDRELDEKIADYYKRKQEKINEYTKSQIEDAYVEDKKPESENIDYADIFNGEVEKRSVVLGEEEPEEEIPEEVVEEQVPQETDFQSLYHSLNADNFEEYTERFVTPASEQVHGETFVSEREEEPVAENTYDNERVYDEEENNQTTEEEVEDEENAYNQTFTDDELVDSEMLEARHIDDSDNEEGNDIYDLSDDDSLDDYIVSSNMPYESNNSDNEDNTMVINSNDLPENKFNYLADNLEDNLDEENGERIIDGDAISKQEFYSEMARLQENLINQLKGENKVEEEKVEVQAPQTNMSNSTLDKALDIINHLTQTKQEQPAPVYDSKANAVADQLIDNIDKEMQIDRVMDEENSQVDSAENEDNGEKDYNQIFASVEEVVEDETPQEEIEEVTFNGDSLLNKDVALNDSDLQYIVNSEKLKSEKKDYFYMSEEDKEKKKEDESYIQKTTSVDGKEMGDINLNKDIANAIPTVEVIENNEQNQTPKIDDMEVIHTIFGVQKKKAEKADNEIKVLYVTSECLPFIATGGLADVAGSLPKAINKSSDVDVRVIMPLYGKIKNEYGDKLEYICNFTVHLSWRQEYCGLFKYTLDGVTYYFVDNERYFKRDSLYGFYDDGERFAYFCKAVVEGLPMLNFFPDIIHCNDWQSALVSTYIKTGNWSDFRYYKIKNIYTIHNVEYQGIYGMENLKDLFGIDFRFRNDLDYNGDINLTKAAIQFSDKFTTVSNSYCDNLKQPYCSRGLNHIIVRNEYKMSGIINGIDLDYYNPATDSVIYKNYDVNTLDDKVYNKKILQDELGLPVDAKTPLIGMATRLVSHKGLDLVTKILEGILEKDVQFIIVGTGDQRYIDYFKYLENKYPTKVRALVDKYSNENARKLYASSDIFLMPSKIEPCGISQMIASRYGSVPIVREVGGLKDTIRDFGCAGGGNGYTFANYNPNDLEFQINRALSDYRDEIEWKKKMRTIMSMDFSWENSARKYIDLYKSLVD